VAPLTRAFLAPEGRNKENNHAKNAKKAKKAKDTEILAFFVSLASFV
jgi:hypothetical protein